MFQVDEFEEKILKRVPKEILISSFVLAVIAIFIFDILTALFVFAGGILSCFSFVWLKQSVTKFLSLEKKKTLRSSLLLYVIRLLLIIGLFFIIILFFSTKIIAFAVGFSTIIIVFLGEATAALSKLKEWKN